MQALSLSIDSTGLFPIAFSRSPCVSVNVIIVWQKIYLGEKLCVHKLCNLFRPQPVFRLMAKDLSATSIPFEIYQVKLTE